jgi:glutamine synthetase
VSETADSLRAQGVHTLLVQFTDVNGVAKGKFVPIEHLGDVLTIGAGFAGPSIVGTGLPRTGPRAEYFARGDIATAMPMPWMPGYARIVGDGFVDNAPFDACPRQVLHRAVAALAQHGLTLQVGIEPEFFLLRKQDDGQWVAADADDKLDKPSYDLKTLPRQAPFLRALHEALAQCGLDVLQIDHEDARSQYELNFRHDGPIASADKLMLFKLAAHAIAESHGMLCSMMPKPFADQPGSGMHFHVSLWRGNQNAFDSHGSAFIAGVLAHAPALCAIAAPTVNSYKRLQPAPSRSGSSWVPTLASHGPNNRTAMVRTLPGRFEWRLPDASVNPYLAIAALIAAGLDGIERRLDPGPGSALDLTESPPAASSASSRLPRDLHEALDALEADEVIAAALGTTLRREFVRLKRAEHAEHAAHVSVWELDRYAAAF